MSKYIIIMLFVLFCFSCKSNQEESNYIVLLSSDKYHVLHKSKESLYFVDKDSPMIPDKVWSRYVKNYLEKKGKLQKFELIDLNTFEPEEFPDKMYQYYEVEAQDGTEFVVMANGDIIEGISEEEFFELLSRD